MNSTEDTVMLYRQWGEIHNLVLTTELANYHCEKILKSGRFECPPSVNLTQSLKVGKSTYNQLS